MWHNLQNLTYNPVKLRMEFLQHHNYAQIPAKPQLDISDITDVTSLMRAALTKGSGIIFGEQHFDNVSAGFLADNMEYLASLGVDILFFEGLFYGMERGPDNSRDEFESTHPEYTSLIKTAQKYGIKVIGLDSKGCKRGDGITRGIFFNAHAAAIINNTSKNKWIALTGMMHLNNDYFIDSVTLQEHKVQGISELTGATSLILHSISEGEAPYISHQKSFKAWPGKYITPDFTVGIHVHKHVLPQYRGKEITNFVEELYQEMRPHGWELTHYDIDTYAKYSANTGYIKGIIFGFKHPDNNTPPVHLKDFSEGNRWLTTKINTKNKEITIFCDFYSVEMAADVVRKAVIVER